MRPLPIGLGAVAIFAWWAVEDGAASPTVGHSGAVLFLAALVVVAFRTGFPGLPRPGRWALLALAGFTVWSFASIAWAGARGDAWEAADRALVYLIVFALFATLPWRPAEAAAVLGAFSLAIVATGVWAVAAAITGAEPAGFSDGRLVGPVGYENATAALLLCAFWPALMLAADRSTPPVARAILLAAAGVLSQLAVLAQSRGSVAAFAVSLALALLLHRERVRLLVFLAAVGVTTVASLPALLQAYGTAAEAGDDVRSALVAVAAAMGASAAVLVGAGLAADRLHGLGSAPVAAPRGRWLAGAAALALLAALAASVPDTRLTAGASSGRYDFWRVAAGQLADQPLYGAGAGNFAHDYVRERRRSEEPLYPHSIILGTAGQLGLVGISLLAGFFAAAFMGLRRLGGPDDPRRAVGLVAVVAAAAWLAQASLDWLWELPGLTAPAIAFLGLVQGLAREPAGAAEAAPEPLLRPVQAAADGGRPLALAAGALLACAAAGSFALPALAARDVERAVRDWDTDRDAALADLERAHRLDPLSARADVIAGALAGRDGDRARAGRLFARAVDRDAADWYAQVQLGLLELEQGRAEPALARLELARRLNPREPLVAAALAAARGGGPPPAATREQLASVALAGPLGRRPLDCPPVLGIGRNCLRGDSR